ncbi:protein kinase [Solirubrobacter phytolaccae]|uniref:non-specific serine/threonine protein kinase n=1 Tax=Solirubrobacter phytolaccae TaxID=1404360 RepID=A0A9X3SAZ2_9ACTN|nr:protein kinase [Solirubrobacter phytolaccae]MDA0184233.1 protein kinase [Solirubrobacter phytolaccae]
MSTLVGMQLSGRYRLDAQIGAGGMSTVYRAFDQNLERRVAIKLLHREMSSDSDQLERFRREARAVAQLSHPHVVGVIDTGEDENRPYIVFEYVEGETLKDRIRRLGRLPVDESLAYAIEIARALGSAHAHDIVHRDVKPQNVLLDPEGSAKVTDFGIARSLRDDGLTADGRVLGTTDYVSPEQALGHDVDGQSDIYSLGVVLFEMLTGDVPFGGENQIAVAMKHVREDLPDIQALRPEVSATTAAVLDRMTDKDLAHRYPDVPALIADLEDALAIEAARSGTSTGEATAVIRTLPARTQRRLPFRMRHSIPLLGVLALIGVGVAIVAILAGIGDVPERVERGTGPGRVESTPQGTKTVSVPRGSAQDYDPLGDEEEHSEEANRVVDRDDGTTWTTETYEAGIEGAGKAGVGIYIDARPEVEAVAIQVKTPKPGFKATIYAAPAGTAPKSVPDGWTKVGGGTVKDKDQRFKLDTGGKKYRYYLVWITDLGDSDSAEISEIRLFQEVAA